MAARQRFDTPTGTDEQRRCALDYRCASRTRDPETLEWKAAAGNPLCPADADMLVHFLGEMPACYARLAGRSTDPLKTGRAVRVPPGSRVLVSPEADALMRTTADVLGGWAARVRAVPGLRLSRHGHPHRSQDQVTADARTLAAHHVQLLALPPGPVAREWTWHPDGMMPGWLEEEIGGLDAVRGGDGWVRAYTALSGEDAALEVFELRRDAVKYLMETPAPRDLLDGVPCRSCEAMSSLEVLPQEPPDPEKPEPVFCRCSARNCSDEMTASEYKAWIKQYDGWVKGAGVKTCKRCERGDHEQCQWRACQCRAQGHAKAA